MKGKQDPRLLSSNEGSGKISDLRGNPSRRFTRGSAQLGNSIYESYGSMPDAPSPKRSKPADGLLGGPKEATPSDKPSSEGPAHKPIDTKHDETTISISGVRGAMAMIEPKRRSPADRDQFSLGQGRRKQPKAHDEATINISGVRDIPKTVQHEEATNPISGVRPCESKRERAGRFTRPGDRWGADEREPVPSLGKEHPEEVPRGGGESEGSTRREGVQYQPEGATPVGAGISSPPSVETDDNPNCVKETNSSSRERSSCAQEGSIQRDKVAKACGASCPKSILKSKVARAEGAARALRRRSPTTGRFRPAGPRQPTPEGRNRTGGSPKPEQMARVADTAAAAGTLSCGSSAVRDSRPEGPYRLGSDMRVRGGVTPLPSAKIDDMIPEVVRKPESERQTPASSALGKAGGLNCGAPTKSIAEPFETQTQESSVQESHSGVSPMSQGRRLPWTFRRTKRAPETARNPGAMSNERTWNGGALNALRPDNDRVLNAKSMSPNGGSRRRVGKVNRHVSPPVRPTRGKKGTALVTCGVADPEGDGHPVGAAAEGSSHQRSAGCLALKSDRSETRSEGKPRKGSVHEETVEGSSHQRFQISVGTPGRGGVFNRETQRVETPTAEPARVGVRIALSQSLPSPSPLYSESISCATVQENSDHTASPCQEGTRQTMWVSESEVSQELLPVTRATTAMMKERGSDISREEAREGLDSSALVTALLSDHEAPRGVSRNAPEMQQSTVPCSAAFACPYCDTAYKTKSGLTLHCKSRHPVEANEAVVVERSKPRWEAEERYLLAKREAELLLAGAKLVNSELQRSFPGRTLESIKGQRKRLDHKQLVASLLEAAPTGDEEDAVENEEGPPPVAGASSADATEGILSELRKLTQKRYPQVFQSERLWDIAKQACEGGDVTERVNSYIRDVFVCDKGQVHGRKGNRTTREKPMSRRKRKRREYAKTQNLFRKRQGDCARCVLDGTPAVEVEDPNRLLAEWKQVMCPSRACGLAADTLAETQEGAPPPAAPVNLFLPVTAQEVKENLPPVKSAPGPDGFTARLMRTVPSTTLRVIMNLLVLIKRVPTSLRGARTTLIPKKSPAKSYSDFRPITVSSVLLRLYHRILAKRMLSTLSFDYRQRAFTPVDGCAENVFLLASVLEDAKQKLRPLHMASLDLSKAFDSVTTDAIIRGARRAGLNQEFLDYLRDLYEDSWTTLSLEGASLLVQPTVGVRQGDPLSPLLFNLMLDEYLQSLDPNIGYRSQQLQLDGMAFADDLLVFASTPKGLQQRLDGLHAFLGARGLKINTEKSFTVSIVPSGREKRTKVVTTSAFTVAGNPLPASGICARWKYLGVEFTPNGRNVPLTADVASMLERVTKAPLKPQQRLVILRFYLIPRLYHRLVLGAWNSKLLKRLDIQIRAAVRKWMALPHDVPLGYYHAPVGEGGLGVASLRTAIPWMQLRRLSRMSNSSSPFCRQAAGTSMVQTATAKAEKACEVRGQPLRNKRSVDKHWSFLLHASNDGGALREVRLVPEAQCWVKEGTSLLSGKAFIDVNKLRINALPVRTRTRRGRDADKNCRGGCQATETLDHVLQKCHRTHAARIRRHDGIVNIIADRLRKKGWTVETEKRISGPGQPLYPDIIARRGPSDRAVIDATVITCGYALEAAHESKIAKYDVPQVRAVARGLGTSDPLVTSATLNFRGVWCRTSAQDLLSLGLTKQDLKIITIRCLQGGVHCFRTHQRMTSMS